MIAFLLFIIILILVFPAMRTWLNVATKISLGVALAITIYAVVLGGAVLLGWWVWHSWADPSMGIKGPLTIGVMILSVAFGIRILFENLTPMTQMRLRKAGAVAESVLSHAVKGIGLAIGIGGLVLLAWELIVK